MSAYSRYEKFDLLIVSGDTLTISRTREEAGCLKVTAIEGVTLRELLTEADIRLYADKKRRRKTVLK